MARPKRIVLGGHLYHVLNRANNSSALFEKDEDFALFQQILAEGCTHVAMRICGYCIMPDHWHLLLWPYGDGELSDFMRWVTHRHTQCYHASRGTAGMGHVYQGRYRSFPVQPNSSYLAVLKYIESEPMHVKLVQSPAQWPWSSLTLRRSHKGPFALSEGPLRVPSNWDDHVRQPIDEALDRALQQSIARGTPFGDSVWVQRTAVELELQSTLRRRGRPKKEP